MIAGQQIGVKFLEELDILIAENWRNLRCNQVHDMYFDFWRKLKNLKGNSNGFNGLSELLILRILYQHLGGFEHKDGFKKDLEKRSKDTRWFVSTSNKRICIAPEYPFKIGMTEKGRDKLAKPDIVIYEYEESSYARIKKLIGAIEVKTYLPNSSQTVEETVKTLGLIRNRHLEMLSSLIIFSHKSNGEELGKSCNIPSWLRICVLRYNDELLWKVLDTHLNLKGII
jgi:hypothetical protein